MITMVIGTRCTEESIQQMLLNAGLEQTEIFRQEDFPEKSLAEFYNLVLQQSKNEYILFCTADILIEQENWGKALLHELENHQNYSIFGWVGSLSIDKFGYW